jgi:hypothetical protein
MFTHTLLIFVIVTKVLWTPQAAFFVLLFLSVRMRHVLKPFQDTSPYSMNPPWPSLS